ncbi:hypothetical protein [Chryseobacterium sp. AG363]|uniref:hypothetical protein n=1 Tax=Chryseobacterium sp. AG363 TaxID=2183997 RepID=UPI000FF8611D|nr:hypothetical protein [Chryseobacterium sp. AG363]RKE77166.1 hypothetical protein DEU39_3926 [Chryseobacterium sp. AG363]
MKKLKKVFILACIITFVMGNAQNAGSVGINTEAPDGSAALDIVSPNSDRGILIPRLTSGQKDSIRNPANGLMIYNISVPCLQINNGTPNSPRWDCMQSSAVNNLDCGGVINEGDIIEQMPVVDANSVLPYKRGDGSAYLGQSVSSIGVLGLTATLAPDNFLNGDGQLIFNITGTALTSGVAIFPINIAGQSCLIVREVRANIGTLTGLNCSSIINNGTLIQGATYSSTSGVSFVIPYTGGNGMAFNKYSVTSNGVAGLTATLEAGNFATGSGNLTFKITGTPISSGTASFVINIGGYSCTINRTIGPAAGAITGTLNCGTATNNGTLTQNVSASGVSSYITYTGGNGGSHSGQQVNSTGVTGLKATLVAGNFANGSGSLTYTISGTPSASGTASFAINIGGKSCTFSRTVNTPAGTISSLNCSNITQNGKITRGLSATGISFTIPYSGGNGYSYSSQTVNSTGVTGLKATLAAGNFVNGSGSLTYTISGTPSASGTASFAINIGGKSCTINYLVYEPGTNIIYLYCSGQETDGKISYSSAGYVCKTTIPYSGGDGTTYPDQYVQSTGVTGVTGRLLSGTYQGAGLINIVYYGKPNTNSPGTATFTFNIGGKPCTINVPVILYN